MAVVYVQGRGWQWACLKYGLIMDLGMTTGVGWVAFAGESWAGKNFFTWCHGHWTMDS